MTLDDTGSNTAYPIVHITIDEDDHTQNIIYNIKKEVLNEEDIDNKIGEKDFSKGPSDKRENRSKNKKKRLNGLDDMDVEREIQDGEVYTYIHLSTCIHDNFSYTHIDRCRFFFVFIHIYIYPYTYIYIYTCINTYIHTYTYV
jgi:ribosomal protein S21